jgi:membrane protein
MWRHLVQDRILLSAASLAFQTLLSLVPLLAVVLSTLKGFPFFAELKRSMAEFLFQNFSPAQGAVLREYLWSFIDKASGLSTVGGLFLFIIALFLISTVDHTLNGIWEVLAPRKPVQGFTLYWTVLTLGPVLIGTSLAASSFVWYEVFMEGPLPELRTRLVSFVPILNSIVAFSLLYLIVPNRRVRFRHALAGGALAAVLFELARRWFTFYVSHFATFEHIYGALSVVPMLFFWIYLEWVVVLTAAELVFSLGYFSPSESALIEGFDPLAGLPELLVVLSSIRSGQVSGHFMTMKTLMSAENMPARSKLSRIVDHLEQHGVIHRTAEGGFALSADPHRLTLYDLYLKLPQGPHQEEVVAGSMLTGERFEGVRRRVLESIRTDMGVPLTELLEDFQHQGVS